MVITRPLASLGVMSRRKALSIVAAAWVYSMGWSLPPFFGWSEYDLDTVSLLFRCDSSQGFSLFRYALALLSGSLCLCQRVKFLLNVGTIIANRCDFTFKLSKTCNITSVIRRQITSCFMCSQIRIYVGANNQHFLRLVKPSTFPTMILNLDCFHGHRLSLVCFYRLKTFSVAGL